MSRLCNLSAITASIVAIAAISFPTYAGAAGDRTAVTTEFSAETVDKNKKAPARVAPVRSAPVRVAPVHTAPVHVQTAPRIERRVVTPNGGQQNIQVQKNIEVHKNIGVQKTIGVQKNLGPKIVTPGTGTPHIIQNNTGGPKTAHKVFTPKGKNAGVVIAAKIRSAPARGAFRTSIRGRNYSVWRSGYRARYNGGWRTFVALSTLGALAIGANEYYPYAYIDAPQDYCDGLTEDGCQMVYDDVETEEGDVVPQCIAYCPWQ
jgi:hypothetical protein